DRRAQRPLRQVRRPAGRRSAALPALSERRPHAGRRHDSAGLVVAQGVPHSDHRGDQRLMYDGVMMRAAWVLLIAGACSQPAVVGSDAKRSDGKTADTSSTDAGFDAALCAAKPANMVSW